MSDKKKKRGLFSIFRKKESATEETSSQSSQDLAEPTTEADTEAEQLNEIEVNNHTKQSEATELSEVLPNDKEEDPEVDLEPTASEPNADQQPEPIAISEPQQKTEADSSASADAQQTGQESSNEQSQDNEIVSSPEAIEPTEITTAPAKKGFFARLKSGLSKTRQQLTSGIADLVLGSKQIDDDLLEEIETQLLMADVGVAATRKIVDDLTAMADRKELKDPSALMERLRFLLSEIVSPCSQPLEIKQSPFVMLMVGVNGVGKTTTIGKLAKKFQSEGKSVMLAAGDTFRAAAVEQLQVWGERNNIHVTAQHTGADSASVVFDALQAAQSRDVDVLIADTAGRLHTKTNLMDELEKVVRVMKKLDPNAPHEIMLVVDAGTGQNALSQAEHFHKAVGLTGISITKLDGTAKGGVIFALADKLQIPIRFIGVGEAIDDLRSFDADDFINALFNENDLT